MKKLLSALALSCLLTTSAHAVDVRFWEGTKDVGSIKDGHKVVCHVMIQEIDPDVWKFMPSQCDEPQYSTPYYRTIWQHVEIPINATGAHMEFVRNSVTDMVIVFETN